MSQLPNPHENKPFERFYDKQNPDGSVEHEYGVRRVDGHEEMVHLLTGRSNMSYWKPEYAHDLNCNHEFSLTGQREIECLRCGYSTTFHAGRNIIEEDQKTYVVLHTRKYPIVHL